MLKARWIKEAEKNGWRVTGARGQVIAMRCHKQGCPGVISAPMDNLGQPPGPCTLPHHDQYAAPVYQSYVDLVEDLKRRRRLLGLSQEDINAAAGLADGHLNKLEALHRTAQFPTLQLWAATLGVQITGTPAPLPPSTARAIERRPAPLRETSQQKGLFDE